AVGRQPVRLPDHHLELPGPREDQQKVLLVGIVFAIIARTGLIFVGAALIDNFSWMFYIFGAILIVTAINMLRGGESDESQNIVVRLARRFLHTSEHYDGDKLTTIENGKRVLTPMLLVMVAIGGTDILFALDSIPAIFGLPPNTSIVSTTTELSLQGRSQPYLPLDHL